MTAIKSVLAAHLRSGRFLSGEAKGRWSLIRLAEPFVTIEIAAKDGRRFALRFDCTGYPDQPPTATVWNLENDAPLAFDQWPRGGRVSQVFNPSWKSGAALYIPCDRQAIEGHTNWANEYSWLIWNPQRGLLQYVEAVSELLQSNELHAAA